MGASTATSLIGSPQRSPAAGYRAVLEHFADAKVIGVTATPDRTDSVALGNVFESVAYEMGIADGIAQGWLAPIALRCVQVESLDLSGVSRVAGDLHLGELEAALTDEAVLHQVALPLSKLCKGRPTIAFAAGVKQAHGLATLLEHYGVRAAAVDGTMKREQRADVLQRYREGQLDVVVNCALWTEGFDEPRTSCIALVRPTSSRSLLTQMIGRGTRLCEGKTDCLVLDFDPGRAGNIRLACPADVLAGEPLPDQVVARVRRLSREGDRELGELIATAKADLAEEQRALLERFEREQEQRVRVVREIGVWFLAHELDTATLLAAARKDDEPAETRAEWKPSEASPSQLQALRHAGLPLPVGGLSRRDARALLNIVRQRREAGLCSIKQARKLRSYGLRDNVSFADAQRAFDAIKKNGWRVPAWMYCDPRLAAIDAKPKLGETG